jgi:hypothetical protein
MALVPIVLAWLALIWFVLALCRSARIGDLQLQSEELARAAARESEIAAMRSRDASPAVLSSRDRGAGVPSARPQRPPSRATRPAASAVAQVAGGQR